MEFTENAFERRARKIHRYLRTDVRFNEKLLRRPYLFELTGTPSAGKTTTITELDKFFRRMGFRVLRPQEGAEVIRHIERTTPIYNVRTATYALNLLIDLAHGHQYDIVLFDRCLFDAYHWMMYWQEKGKLTPEQAKTYQSFFLAPLWTDFLDGAYFLICEPEEAMKRELKIALSKKLGETTNPETIRILVERYRRAFGNLKNRFPQLTLLETTRLDEKTMVEHVACEMLDTMERKTTAR